jgi:hypothetical protein
LTIIISSVGVGQLEGRGGDILPRVKCQITRQSLCKRCQKIRDKDWITGSVVYERRASRHGKAWSVDEPVCFCFGPFAEDEKEVFHFHFALLELVRRCCRGCSHVGDVDHDMVGYGLYIDRE